MPSFQSATRQLVINKFKNKRRGDNSEEVIEKRRQRTGLENYLPADREAADCGELRHKLRTGALTGTEVSMAIVSCHAHKANSTC